MRARGWRRVSWRRVSHQNDMSRRPAAEALLPAAVTIALKAHFGERDPVCYENFLICPHRKSLTAQPAAKPDYAYESGCAKVEGDETKGTVTLFIEVETEPLTVTLSLPRLRRSATVLGLNLTRCKTASLVPKSAAKRIQASHCRLQARHRALLLCPAENYRGLLLAEFDHDFTHICARGF